MTYDECRYLLIGLVRALDSALLQRVVVVEEEEENVPEDSALVHVRLQPEVYSKCAHTLRYHCAQ